MKIFFNLNAESLIDHRWHRHEGVLPSKDDTLFLNFGEGKMGDYKITGTYWTGPAVVEFDIQQCEE